MWSTASALYASALIGAASASTVWNLPRFVPLSGAECANQTTFQSCVDSTCTWDANLDTCGDTQDWLSWCNKTSVLSTGVRSVQHRVSASTDDAEELVSSGRVDLSSSDLELIYDKQDHQVVGVRFSSISVPRFATILNATVQFHADRPDPRDENGDAIPIGPITITAQAADNGGEFRGETHDISSRTDSAASVVWTPAEWENTNDEGAAQRTPDIAALLQEVVNRPGWGIGNAFVLKFAGSALDTPTWREAESYDGESSAAPLLSVTFSQGGESACTSLEPLCQLTAQTQCEPQLCDSNVVAYMLPVYTSCNTTDVSGPGQCSAACESAVQAFLDHVASADITGTCELEVFGLLSPAQRSEIRSVFENPERFLSICGGNINFRLLHISDEDGEVMPLKGGSACPLATARSDDGCIGGAPRRIAYAREARAMSNNTVVLNAGNFFWGSQVYFRAKETVTDLFNEVGYDAMGAGNKDFYEGPVRYASMQGDLPPDLSLVAANMDATREPSLRVEEYVVKTIGDDGLERKVGIIGMVDDNLADVTPLGSDVLVSPGVKDVELAALRLRSEHPDCNIIVLLASLPRPTGDETLYRVGRLVHEIDIVLARGSSAPELIEPKALRASVQVTTASTTGAELSLMATSAVATALGVAREDVVQTSVEGTTLTIVVREPLDCCVPSDYTPFVTAEVIKADFDAQLASPTSALRTGELGQYLDASTTPLLSQVEGQCVDGAYSPNCTRSLLVLRSNNDGEEFGNLIGLYDSLGRLRSNWFEAESVLLTQDVVVDDDARGWDILNARIPAIEAANDVVLQTMTSDSMQQDLCGRTSPHPCASPWMVADAIMDACPDCDLALMNYGGIRSSLEGSVTTADLFSLLPYSNQVATFTTKGANIFLALQLSLDTSSIQGRFLGVAGLQFVYNPTTKTVIEVRVRNRATGVLEPLDTTKFYRVGTNDFIRMGGDGYEMFTNPEDPNAAPNVFDVFDVGPPLQQPVADRIANYSLDLYPNSTAIAACFNVTLPLERYVPEYCRVSTTEVDADFLTTCVSDEKWCQANPSLFGMAAGDCTKCSGYGTCELAECTCTQPPLSSFWGMHMDGKGVIRGSDCSDARSVFVSGDAVNGTLWLLGCLTALVSLLTLVLLVYYRDQPIIKAASPNFSIVSCVGGLVMAASIFLVIPETGEGDAVLCNARVFALAIGFQLLFTGAFARAWRIQKIFSMKTMQEYRKFKVSDWDLWRVVGAVTGFHVVLLALFALQAPMEVEFAPLGESEWSAALQCRLNDSGGTLFSISLFVFGAALLLWGVYLAWKISRNVEIRAFNDSKYLGFAIYNIAFCVIAAVPILSVLAQRPSVAKVIGASFVCYGSIFTLVVMFWHKFYQVRYRTAEEQQSEFSGFSQQPRSGSAGRRGVMGNGGARRTHLSVYPSTGPGGEPRSEEDIRAVEARLQQLEQHIEKQNRVIEKLGGKAMDAPPVGGGKASSSPLWGGEEGPAEKGGKHVAEQAAAPERAAANDNDNEGGATNSPNGAAPTSAKATPLLGQPKPASVEMVVIDL